MENLRNGLEELNAINPNLQYHFVLSGPTKWVLIKEIIEGPRSVQSVAVDALTEESFAKFYKELSGKTFDKNRTPAKAPAAFVDAAVAFDEASSAVAAYASADF